MAMRASLLGQMARVRRDRGDLSEAETLLKSAIDEAPGFPDLHQQLGMLLLEESNLPRAREAFERARSISPGYIAPALGLVLVLANEGQLGEAIHSLEELNARSTPAEEDCYREGLELLRHGSWEEAEPLLLRAFHQADDDLVRAQREVGRLLDADSPLEALEAARGIVSQYPSYPDSHHAVGLSCLALEWWDDANEAFSRALRCNSQFHEARIYLAWVLFSRGESARAEAELRRILEADPDHRSARGLLGRRGRALTAERRDSAA
jgi:tetratricopeptide (TPR) repeat protein